MTTVVITDRAQIMDFRATMCWMAMKTHIVTKGGMMVTRGATPKNLMNIAQEYTGVPYGRGSIRKAFEDLGKLIGKPIETEKVLAA